MNHKGHASIFLFASNPVATRPADNRAVSKTGSTLELQKTQPETIHSKAKSRSALNRSTDVIH